MRPILSAKQAMEGLLRNARRQAAFAIDEAKREGLKIAEDLSPRPSSPYADHRYATGEYASSWEWDGNRLRNTTEHAKYTDEGYTRYGGRNSAKPWIARGKSKYSDQIATRIGEVLREAFRGRR